MSLQEEDGCIVWRVKDNGIGIPADDQEHIFERFYRVDKARGRDTGGTGLGLSIVKQMVKMHGGSISVHSEPGKGSEFVVTFPQEGDAVKRRVICLLTAFCLLFVLTGCTDSSMEEKHAPAPTLPPAEDRYHAPDGDESLGINREYRMFFPRTDGLYLVSRTTEVDGENLLDTVEHLLLNLFAFKGDTEALKIGGNKPVGLYGTHPMEISGGVCTVNLTSSILPAIGRKGL